MSRTRTALKWDKSWCGETSYSENDYLYVYAKSS